jgi:Lrp/AsnC family transcriptional regulator for asnA, asnC and gidA
MATGFVFINTGPARDRDVFNELSEIKEIVELHQLLGEYTMVAKVVSEDLTSMFRVVVDKIRPIRGVLDTKTMAEIML